MSQETIIVEVSAPAQARLEAMLAERIDQFKESAVVLRDGSSGPEICARRVIHLVDRHLSRTRLVGVASL